MLTERSLEWVTVFDKDPPHLGAKSMPLSAVEKSSTFGIACEPNRLATRGDSSMTVAQETEDSCAPTQLD
jgi:hypothetical protein